MIGHIPSEKRREFLLRYQELLDAQISKPLPVFKQLAAEFGTNEIVAQQVICYMLKGEI